MKSNKSYLLQAFYQWIIDSDYTPILKINTAHSSYTTTAPKGVLAQRAIVSFNISKKAVEALEFNNELIYFISCVQDEKHTVKASIDAVVSLHAEEIKETLYFNHDGHYIKSIIKNDREEEKQKNMSLKPLKINCHMQVPLLKF